ncbi:MAG: fibronectin type III domain-containing protein [Bacteroidales bacterium]|nr:fibronectin type III domain-containing protein [Bacteroidales bacterium]
MVKGKLLKSAAPVLLLFLAACSRENIRITDLTVLPMTVTTSSAVLSWDNPDGTREGDVYEIWLDGQMAAQSRVTHITLDRLKASTDYKVKVRGIDAKGREGDFQPDGVFPHA